MAEKMVIAHRVRLKVPSPSDSTGSLGLDWLSSKVSSLVVFPDSKIARCRIKIGDNEKTFIGDLGYAEVDESSQDDWERSKLGCVCPDCGQTFENAQGLGNHRAIKHPQALQPQAQKAQQSKRGA